MPMYAYACHRCDVQEDRVVKYDEREAQQCSSCGDDMEREEIGQVSCRQGTAVTGQFVLRNGRTVNLVDSRRAGAKNTKLGWG